MRNSSRNFRATIILIVFIIVCSFLLLPGYEINVLAAEADSFDALAKQAVVNSYQRYYETEGKISPTSNNIDLDSYSIYVLTEANVAVDQWVYEESTLITKVVELIENTKQLEADENPENDVNAKYVAHQYLAAKGLKEETLAQELLVMLINRQNRNDDGNFFKGAYSQWTNLPVFDALRCAGVIDKTDMEKGIDYILSLQFENGSYTDDFMSTAQAVRTLSALKENKPEYRLEEVETAINSGLSWMQAQLKEDGSVVYESEAWSDDAVTDTAETILTLTALEIEIDSWQDETTGESPVDFMLKKSRNLDGTFGSGNLGANNSALAAFICLGARVSDDTALMIKIEPQEVELGVDEEKAFTATAFLANGDIVAVTTTAEWTVSDPAKALLNLADETMVIRRISAGDFELEAIYQTVNCKQVITTRSSSGGGGSNPSTNKIRVSVSVIGENRERLFSGNVTLNKNQATVFDALVATGLSYQGDSNFISAIEGQRNRGLNGWMVKVNDELISAAIDSYTLGKGDTVEWFYSSDSGNSVEKIGGSRKSGNQVSANPQTEEIKLDPETYLLLFQKAEQVHTVFQKAIRQFMNDSFTYLKWVENCLNG